MRASRPIAPPFPSWRALTRRRFLRFGVAALLLLLGLGACSDSLQHAENFIAHADLATIRRDAAILVKNNFATEGTGFVLLDARETPKSFHPLAPLRISIYRDGVALALTMSTEPESGLYIMPEGIATSPEPHPRARYRLLREGIYRYDFGDSGH